MGKDFSFQELGATGLRHYRGIIDDEYRKELRGKQALKVYREMGDDPIVSACLKTLKQLIAQTPIRVKPGADPRATELVETAIDDMSQTWANTRMEQLSHLQYGWSVSEVVPKLRKGDNAEPSKKSRYTDGLRGWRKMAPRAQDSLDHWGLDDAGGVQAFFQRPAPKYDLREIPIDRLLLFQTEPWKGSPEGRCLLSGVYLPWYFQRKIKVIEAIGVERDMAGMPKISAPGDVLDETNPLHADKLAALRALGANLKIDQQAYVLVPSDVDPSTNAKLYDFELISSNSNGRRDTGVIIQRYQRDMAIAMLCDFVLLGHENVGSFALTDSKKSITAMAVKGWNDADLAVYNRHAIPRLLRDNGMDTSDPPQLEAGDVETPNLLELAQAISLLTGAGALFPDQAVEQAVREVAHLPSLEDMPVSKREDAAGLRLMIRALQPLQAATKRLIAQMDAESAVAA